MPKIISYLLAVLLLGACHSQPRFKDGDILFRGKQSGALSSAIDEVTQTGSANHYTHMGVVEMRNGKAWVWHAAPDKGVVCEPLDTFCRVDSMVIGQYRIKKISAASVRMALDEARKRNGQPYDNTYMFENKGYYCSEFVYEIFAHEKVFTLQPMTFKDPATGEYHEGWVEHYRTLGIEIPEGQPGCNPNGMATSPNIEFLGYIPK